MCYWLQRWIFTSVRPQPIVCLNGWNGSSSNFYRKCYSWGGHLLIPMTHIEEWVSAVETIVSCFCFYCMWNMEKNFGMIRKEFIGRKLKEGLRTKEAKERWELRRGKISVCSSFVNRMILRFQQVKWIWWPRRTLERGHKRGQWINKAYYMKHIKFAITENTLP